MSDLIVTRLGTDGDLARGFGDVITKSAATAQKVACRLKLVQAEWFLDPDQGVPWFALPGTVDPPIMGSKGVDLGYVERVLKTTILETTGVSKLVSFALDLNRQSRTCTVSAVVETDDGDIENIEVLLP